MCARSGMAARSLFRQDSTMRDRTTTARSRSLTPRAVPAAPSRHLPSGIRPKPTALTAPSRLLTPDGIVELHHPDEFVIGRDPSCALVLDDPLVSRHHATIVLYGDEVLIEDTSTNGVYVNDVRVNKQQRLEAGDRILVG